MTPFYTAEGDTLSIDLMYGLYPAMLSPNAKDNERWWEVIDRTTGEIIRDWSYEEGNYIRHL